MVRALVFALALALLAPAAPALACSGCPAGSTPVDVPLVSGGTTPGCAAGPTTDVKVGPEWDNDGMRAAEANGDGGESPHTWEDFYDFDPARMPAPVDRDR